MCTESTTAIGIKKIAIIEDMICTVNPAPIKAPIVIKTVAIATIIGAMIRGRLRKNTNNNINIVRPAKGAATII